MQYTLLFVDDDAALLRMLSRYFAAKGYGILTAESGGEALKQIKCRPDLILLDINMPDMDGLSVCRRVRDEVAVPILFLSARAEEDDRVNGLLLGGDDYVVKPFSLKELEARIAAHLKREERCRTREVCAVDGLFVDYAAREVRVDGETLPLTRTEYGIVAFLSGYPGQTFSKERIYEQVCGYDAEGDSRGITELVRRIRGKLSARTQTEYIETVWGMGYRWKK